MAHAAESGSEITGINVTPLVDVALVLLIVFVVTSKVIVSQGMVVDVPKGKKTEAVEMRFVVDIDASGAMAVEGRRVATSTELVAAARLAKARDPRVHGVIRAASATRHDAVIGAMDALRLAEIGSIAFAVERKANAGE